ncbi:6-carboxyhexanoate--CoA ligase [Persephonella sp.]
MDLYSIKIRASKEGKHLSGGERIVREKEIERVITQLYKKVSRKNPDEINLKVEKIKEKPVIVKKALKIKNLNFSNYKDANEKALEILEKTTCIDRKKLEDLIKSIHSGASPDGENMRGAMIVNQNGERIELDRYRGIRTTTVDFMDRKKVLKKLIEKNYTERTLDALALTTKNMMYPEMIAEYCISDEADYITGYVSTKDIYYRITPLKQKGNPKGGRIYFVKNCTDLEDFYRFLQEKPVLIEDL